MEQQPLLPEVVTDDEARDALGRLAQNPNLGRGRPRGALNDAYKVCRKILAMESPALMRVAVDMAKAGNVFALRMCLDRGFPVPRSAPLEIDLGPLETIADKQRAIETVTRAVAAGELIAEEGASVTTMLKDAITAQTIALGGAGLGAPVVESDAKLLLMERLTKVADDRRRRAQPPDGDANAA